MNFLMITRKIDSDDWLAGHGYEWAKAVSEKLKAKSAKLVVICLEKGNTKGLEDVEIYSLGKETGNSRWSRFWRMQKLLARQVRRCDGIFAHQNPEYAIVTAPWAYLRGKSIVSWYVHKSVTWKTRLMLAVSSKVLTASKESFRIPSPKVEVVGHGIDTRKFMPFLNKNHNFFSVIPSEVEESLVRGTSRGARDPSITVGMTNIEKASRIFKIVTVGRISPVKGLENMIAAVKILADRGTKAFRLDIVGDIGLPEQGSYLKKLKTIVEDSHLETQVKFLPPVPHDQVAAVYQNSDLFINLSQTGSLDKAVLEAMACEVPVVTSNEAFFGILSAFQELCVCRNDPKDIAEKILKVYSLNSADRQGLGEKLRTLVVKNHSLDRLAEIIVKSF